jgi:hypothetical protein
MPAPASARAQPASGRNTRQVKANSSAKPAFTASVETMNSGRTVSGPARSAAISSG